MKRTLLALVLAAVGSAHAAFDGPYADGNWALNLNGGQIFLDGMPTVVSMISSNTPTPNTEDDDLSWTDLTITAALGGQVSFSWSYMNGDVDGSGWDPFGYLKGGTEESHFTKLTTDDLFTPQSGTVQFTVEAGEVFGFRILAKDSAEGPSFATITDFSAPVPEPGSYALMLAGLGLVGFMARRRMANK